MHKSNQSLTTNKCIYHTNTYFTLSGSMKHLLLLRDSKLSQCMENTKKETVLTPYNAQYYTVINTASPQLTQLKVLCL